MANTSASANFEAMLLKMQRGFLQELPDRLDRIESSLLALEQAFSPEAFNDLFGSVHSLKGSGGTFGVHGVTAICHELEDYLGTLPRQLPCLDSRLLSHALSYIDLMRVLHEETIAKNGPPPEIGERLAAIRLVAFPPKLSALMVVNSSVVRAMCASVLDEAGVRLIEVPDGMQALQRGVAQRFDLVVASAELPLLGGEALIAALQLSGARETDPPFFILIRSDGVPTPRKRNTDPDVILCRNQQFLPTLAKVIAEFLAHRRA